MAAITSATAATLDVALSRLTVPPPRDYYLDGTLLCEDLFYCDHGAIFAQRLGEHQAALALPQSCCPKAADELTRTLVAHLELHGLRVLQAVVPMPPPMAVTCLERLAFHYLTDLTFLAREVTAVDARIPPRLKFEPVAFNDITFAELIDATYEGTEDLPELNGTHNVEETLAACQASAKVDPPLWWTASFAGETLGVLQLAPGESCGDLELVYAGIIPCARRRGFGRELMQGVLAIAVALEAQRVHLSCDVRNHSAGKLYSQLGFHEIYRRGVWLKISDDSPQHSRSHPIS